MRFFAAAYAIGVKGLLFLVAGYDPALVKDKAGFARWMGGGLLCVGIAILGVAILVITVPRAMLAAVGLLPGIVTIGVGILVAGGQRYRA